MSIDPGVPFLSLISKRQLERIAERSTDPRNARLLANQALAARACLDALCEEIRTDASERGDMSLVLKAGLVLRKGGGS